MSKTKLDISPDLSLTIQAIVATFAILAVKRAGKSNAGVVMAEEFYDAGLPWVAIDPKGDWWGVRAAGRAPGLVNVIVFGGLHGDMPLEPTSGNLIADLVVEHRITCVLDVSEMTKADQRRFLTDFATRLYKRNTEPIHVFCEEADEYIPQRVMSETTKLVGAFETLVKRGGFRGIGITMITQRSASLNKDVLTQAGTLIAMRTPSSQDRKAILAWMDYHQAGKDVVDELPLLEAGEAWVFSPQELKVVRKIRFRQRRTFDSGATPEVGGKPRPAAKLADVDLSAIKEAMAETIERAKVEDPKFWRQRVAELEREIQGLAHYKGLCEELEDQLASYVTQPEVVTVNVVKDATVRDLYDAIEGLSQIAESWGGVESALQEVAKQLSVDLARATSNDGYVVPNGAPLHNPMSQKITSVAPVPSAQVRTGARTSPVRAPSQTAVANGDVQLRKGARRMVEVLGKMAPLRLTTAQWSVIAKVKASGGTWGTYLSDINKLGLVEQNDAGWTLTDAGFDYLVDYLGGRPPKMTLEELRAHYQSLLRAGARRMLEVIVDAYPNWVTYDELAEHSEISRAGGTFGTYLSDLTRNQLVVTSHGTAGATDLWFTAP